VTAKVEPAAPVSTSTAPAVQPAYHASAPPAALPDRVNTERRQAAADKSSRKRKAAPQRTLPADDEPVMESARSPQLGEGGRIRQVTIGERPRVVERWIERDFDVPSAGRLGSRSRVTVIHRGAESDQPAPSRGRSASDVYYAKHTEIGD
jgi:hypothetical protein